VKTALIRIGIVLSAAVVLVISAAFTPLALRRFDGFRVQRLEVVGARYLTPEAAATASGITAAANIFDDPTPWIEGLLAHPLVIEASVERQLPGTVRLRIVESKPVALARTPELRAIDERGRVLPADPAAEGMDLPVLSVLTRVSASGHAADSATTRIAAFLGAVYRSEPALLGWISEIGAQRDAIRIVLRNAHDAEVLLPFDPTPARLRELQLTLSELSAPRLTADTARVAPPELARVRRIDGRFTDQIVVALHAGKR
jgi:cell division septal protein FtsQ